MSYTDGQIAEAGRYVRSLRSLPKLRYAQRYLAALTAGTSTDDVRLGADVSTMAGQAVRMRLAEILGLGLLACTVCRASSPAECICDDLNHDDYPKFFYLAVCVDTRYGRAGIVLSGDNQSKLLSFADGLSNRVGYVGCESFEEAVTRAGMMERNESGAWGAINA